ncbi:hypothetical protein F7R05_00205 [Pseudomonas koreensis]|nr:hypothetical protein F7R05_00205 [Pseudomonas koreensis]
MPKRSSKKASPDSLAQAKRSPSSVRFAGAGLFLQDAKNCRSCRRLRSFDLVFEDQKIAAFGSSYRGSIFPCGAARPDAQPAHPHPLGVSPASPSAWPASAASDG